MPDFQLHTPAEYEMHTNQMHYVFMLESMREMV